MKIKDAYDNAKEYLKEQGIDSFLSDARFLLTGYLNCDMTYVLLHPGEEVNYDELKKMLKKRADGVPCAYITGSTEFMGLNFKVNENVLVPRQDTEVLIETIMDFAENKELKILDICTGSGCIAVSLKKFCQNATVKGLDISDGAIEIAEINAKENKADVEFYKCDILKTDALDKYDVLVSNPPYIESEVVEGLDKTVKDFEPRLALDGGEDGLVFYRKIASLAKNALKNNGKIFFEIGYNQGESVKNILLQNGFSDVKVIKDYSGNDRVVSGGVSL